MIDSIRPALGLRLILRTVYVAPLARAPLTRLHLAFAPSRYPSISLRRRVWICLLQLIQAFGLSTALVQNWSSLFLNRMLNVAKLILVKSCRLLTARHSSNVKCLDATCLSPHRPIPLRDRCSKSKTQRKVKMIKLFANRRPGTG